jgi:hypothetical protein
MKVQEAVMSRVHFAFALSALLVSTPLIAQSNASQPDDESILVEGQRTSVTRLVSETINDAGVEVLARFEDAICPGIVGLTGDQALKLVQMIRGNVLALGGKVADPGCTANATVIVVDQPVDFVKQFAKKQPGFFTMTPRELDQFTSAPRAVASWHVTETRDRDGQELDGSDKVSDRKKRMSGTNAQTSVAINARVVRQSAATRLYTNTREDMMFGFAVIDRQRLAGKSLRQLADLATLHLLLDIKQNAGARNRASILSLFEDHPAGSAAPAELSQSDKAMVQGLYSASENNRTPAQQFSQIATAIRRSAGKDR